MSALPSVMRWWVMLCLVSLLGFQSLGLVHRSLHGGGAAPRAVLVGQGQAVGTAVALKSPSLGHLPGSTDCQLLDELSTALGPITQALAWTALLPDHPVSTTQPHSATVAQTWRAPARAPPVT